MSPRRARPPAQYTKARFLRGVLEGMPASVKVIDPQYRLVYVNGKARRMPQAPLNDLRGRPCHQAFYGFNQKCLFCSMSKVFEKGESQTTYTHLNLDGTEREYEVSAFPLKDEDGRVAYAVEVVRDVTPLSRGVALQRKLGKLFTQELALSFVYDQIGLWAPEKGPVLIVGEQGTGKKLVGRALHQLSGRPGSFALFHCLEGDIEEGALAVPGLPGAWEKSVKGTLYLDEATSLTPEAQRDLVKRLTASSPDEAPRLIAATRENLSEALQKGILTGAFVDLFAGHVLQLPALRERRRDLPVLAQHFIEAARSRHGCAAERLGPDALRELLTYHWPGNVLELEARLEGACLLSEGPVIEKLLLPVGEEKVEKLDNLLDRVERSCLSDALTRSEGRLDLTAELTGLAPKTLQRKLKKHSLRPKEFRRSAAV